MIFFLNLVLTWSIGLALPLLIRFAIFRRPISKNIALWIALGNSAVLWIIFTVSLILIGESDPSYGFAWVLVFFAAKAILSSGANDIDKNVDTVGESVALNDKAETISSPASQVEKISANSRSDKKQKNKLLLVIIAIVVIIVPIAFLYVYYYMPAASISLDKNSLTLEVGGEEDFLNASIEPSFLMNRELVWSTTDPNVVTVNSAGLITPTAEGVATVTVKTTDNNKHAKCIVTVIIPTIMWSGGEYTGELKSGIPDGVGEWIHSDGHHYIGQFKGGKKDGKGEMLFPDGSEYEGEWSNDKITGQGYLRLPNGDEYDGYFENGLYHGHGTLKYVTGASYTGGWEKGVKNGMGKLIYQNGLIYEGGFKDNELHGFGTITWPNGTNFRGEFENGNKHGTGEMNFPDGSSLMGVYKNDELTHGVWTYPDGSRSATGPEQWRIYE